MVRVPERILFQGLGGAGQRHLRIFKELLPHTELFGFRTTRKTPVLNSDFTVDKNCTLEERYGIKMLGSMEEAWACKPDLVVISLPSIFHADATVEAAKRRVNVFVEKPGAIDFNQYRAVRSAVQESGIDYFVSFQRRFHPLVQRMREILKSGDLGRIISAQVNIASYVPDWHPFEDFHDLYACNEHLGGGVLRTECHEIELISWLFGAPERVYAVKGRRGAYLIDVDDSAELLLDYRDFGVQMSICFMQRHQGRRITVNGQNGWLDCDLHSNKLQLGRNDTGEIYEIDNPIDMESIFRIQANYFLHEFKTGDDGYLKAVENIMRIINSSISAGK